MSPIIPVCYSLYISGNSDKSPKRCYLTRKNKNKELIGVCLITGFGAFVDKTVLPYTNTNKDKLQRPCDERDEHCQAAFGYRHVLSMTPSEDEFKRKVTEQSISGNLDSPEGSLDAMMQAAVCGVSKEEI